MNSVEVISDCSRLTTAYLLLCIMCSGKKETFYLFYIFTSGVPISWLKSTSTVFLIQLHSIVHYSLTISWLCEKQQLMQKLWLNTAVNLYFSHTVKCSYTLTVVTCSFANRPSIHKYSKYSKSMVHPSD